MEELFERPGPRGGQDLLGRVLVRAVAHPGARSFEAGWGSDKSPDRGAGNKAVMVEIVRRDRPARPPGLRRRHAPWAGAPSSPRADLPRIRSSPSVADLPEDDDDGIWSVSCFYVHGSAKRRGVAGALLEAAVGDGHEGRRPDPRGLPRAPGHGDPFTGHAALFEAAGFTVEMGETSRGLARLEL